jgi:hypothetical protein
MVPENRDAPNGFLRKVSRQIASRAGELAFTLATATKALNFPVCGDLNGVVPFLDLGY